MERGGLWGELITGFHRDKLEFAGKIGAESRDGELTL